MSLRRALLLAAMLGASGPALATPAAPDAASAVSEASAPTGDQWARIFADIRARRYDAARQALAANPSGPLLPIAQAEFWLAPKSGLPDRAELLGWLAAHSDLPQAEALAKLAARLELRDLNLPTTTPLSPATSAPARLPSVTTSPVGRDLAAKVRPLIVDDRPAEAESLYRTALPLLPSGEQAEWGQQIAWSYYLNHADADAIRLAGDAAATGHGDWSAMANWVRGLAAFRTGDCATAGEAFTRMAGNSRLAEDSAGGRFWAARAAVVCGRPEEASVHLRAAARSRDSFYGLLATRMLGLGQPPVPSVKPGWGALAGFPAAERAAALVRIGERKLADAVLRRAATTGQPAQHNLLIAIAASLNMPTTQLWLANHAPDGVALDPAARFPTPDWQPVRGWRVDRALVFAHALQESRFATDAVSHAGARGVMQLMPGTAQLIGRQFSEQVDAARLGDPALNIDYGQAYLEQLRDNPLTGGLLPKVIAAYNAGPGSLKKWADKGRDSVDPLLFIESIPYWETRHYVEQVLRNYWAYERNAGRSSASLEAIAQGLWPRFPGQPGATAVRLNPTPAALSTANDD